MKLFGCGDQKNLVLCEMSVAEIWRQRIDPWHLDLFDEEHVTTELNGIKLSFSPLRQLGCVMEDEFGIFVGIYRHGRQHVFRAQAISQKPFGLLNVAPSSRPFEELFRRHLGDRPENSNQAFRAYEKILPGDLKLAGRHLVTQYDSVISYGGAVPSFERLFGEGMEMFNAVTLAVTPEPKISRILTELAPWTPVIKGRALTNIVCGLPVREVHCFVRFDAIEQVEEYLSSKRIRYTRNQMIDPERPDYELEIELEDCRYMINGTHDEALKYKVGLIPENGVPSIELMECRQADQIRVSRIALFDCRRRQQRDLQLWPQTYSYSSDDERTCFESVPTDMEFRPIGWRTLEEELRSKRS